VKGEPRVTQRNQTTKVLCIALAAALLFSSCNSTIPGISNFNVAVQKESSDQHLYAAFVSTVLSIQEGLTVPIPELANSTVGITPYLPTDGSAPGTGTLFQVDIDLSTLSVNQDFAVAGLPDGRALPDIDGGVLPRWEFTVQPGSTQEDIFVYLSNAAFGIFIPLPLEANGVSLPDTISMEIDDSKGNLLGKAYAIPSSGAAVNSSGILLLIPFIGNTNTSQLN
jgi:hypothetical protein